MREDLKDRFLSQGSARTGSVYNELKDMTNAWGEPYAFEEDEEELNLLMVDPHIPAGAKLY